MSLRRRYLPPVMITVGLVMGALSLFLQASAAPTAATLLVAGCVLLGVLWLVFEQRIRRPLLRVAGSGTATDEILAIEARLDALQKAAAHSEAQLVKARAQGDKAAQSLREHEQRYLLAVKGAHDGLWEWELASDAMYLSPRWKSMLDFDIDGIVNHIDAWKGLIHPEDRVKTVAALDACVAGRTDGFEVQHRVTTRNGELRWIASRGTVLRRANGRPYRVMGLDADVSRLHRAEEILQHVAQGTAAATGESFFRELVRHFAAVIGVRQAFMTECVDFPTTRVRPLATWDGGRFIDDPEYLLAQTPCEEVVCANRTVFVPAGIEQHYACSARQGFTSYLGLPIVGSSGNVIGHLAFQGPERIRDEFATESIFRIFVARAGAELERRQQQQVLLDLATDLSRSQGNAVFEQAARAMALLTGMRQGLVTECLQNPPERVRMLAWWHTDQFLQPVEYDVIGSVCEETLLHARTCHHTHGVKKHYGYGDTPGWDAYLGIPINDSQGRVLGHLAAADDLPCDRPPPNAAALMLLRERAAVEIQRRRMAVQDVKTTVD